jgi:muramidase (phage lysozyme)
MPGAALAKLLGAVPDAVNRHKDNAEARDVKAKKDLAENQAMLDETSQPGFMEQKQLVGLAQMGAERDRVRLAKGTSVFGLLRDNESSIDAYQYNRARREADLMAGQLRDAYAKAGLFENDDPKAFQAFVQQQQQEIFKTLEGADPSYFTGYIERIGGVFEEMATAHAGNLDGFVAHKNKRALESRVGSRVAVDLAVNKERGAFGAFMSELMGPESGNNYNAYFGNAGNTQIRFTDMTIQEVMDWQRRQVGMGKESAAVGKYQFVSGTFRDVVREMGLDPNTKFSPATQDAMAFHRLIKTRGLMDYFEGKQSLDETVNAMADEWAALKRTDGRGAHDGVGSNRASLSASRTRAALIAFKEAYLRDPAKVVKADKGKITLPEVTSSIVDTDSAESEFGVTGSEERAVVADSIIKEMERDPSIAQRDDLDDVMSGYKLPAADRDRVVAARDRLRKETDQKGQMEASKKTAAVLKSANDFLMTGDEAALQTIRSESPDLYERLLDFETTAPDPETLDNEGFLKGVDYSSPRVSADTLKAYVSGEIDRSTYKRVMGQVATITAAKPIVELPAVSEMVTKVKGTIPSSSDQKLFDAQLAISIEDLLEASGGKRPPLSEIQAAIQQVQQTILSLREQDAQTRLSRPEYQPKKQEQNGE